MKVRRDGVLENQNVKQVIGDTWDVGIANLTPINSPASESGYGLPVRPLAAAAYATILEDAGSGITYVGKAVVATATSSAAWQIMKIDESVTGTMTITWANGANAFDQVWDDRASLSYS